MIFLTSESSIVKHLLSFFFVLLLLGTVVACSDDILTDAAAQPSYELNDSTSPDTYHLGVLLTGHTTATQKLMLYNRNKGEIVLDGISLRGGDSSIFRINVDGMAGTSFLNTDYLHIARGDSLFVLVEATFAGRQDERDVEREDWLDIRCNGLTRSIRLAVTTRDVEELHADTLRADTVWQTGGLDKLIYGALCIPQGVTLSIDPGVTLYLHDHASIEVYGCLKIQGTQQQPVTLLGDRTDKIFDNLYYRDMSAQWGGINYYPGSVGNLLQYADVRGMTTGIVLTQDSCDTSFLADRPTEPAPEADPKRYAYGPDFLSDPAQQLIIRHSSIRNSNYSLIAAHNSNMIIENSLLMNSSGAILELAGGAYDVTHCTLANYNYWAAFSQCDVVMRNYDIQSEPDAADELRLPRPLYRCNFTNTLIYGRSGFDPNIDANGFTCFVDDYGTLLDSIYNYRFDHCLLQSSSGYDDDDCLSILWTDDPLYQLVDMPNYVCDPHLQPESPCIGRGEGRTVARLPFDLDGKARPSTPAIGCYEP